MEEDIREISQIAEKTGAFVQQIECEIAKVIVGQKDAIDRLMIGLLANGHILLEGVPGLAKTLTIKTLSEIVECRFQRIQFTPDLLPADIIGTTIYNPRGEEFTTKKGPIFANLILADEINRAPAKVQSALLEAMQERQVTIGDATFPIDEPFMVMATQNPIEQEGTYPLPEAQVDRFMLKLKITYPRREEEYKILERMTSGEAIRVNRIIDPQEIIRVRGLIPRVYMDEKIKNYILDIVFATRFPEKYRLDKLKPLIAYGASPRATIYMALAAKAYAFIRGRGYVTPDDVKSIGMDVLRHRVIVTYEAEAEEMTSEHIVQRVFDEVEVP